MKTELTNAETVRFKCNECGDPCYTEFESFHPTEEQTPTYCIFDENAVKWELIDTELEATETHVIELHKENDDLQTKLKTAEKQLENLELALDGAAQAILIAQGILNS